MQIKQFMMGYQNIIILQEMDSAIESPFSKKNLDVIYFTEKILELTKQYYPELVPYAERRDIIENILMVNSIASSQDFQLI